MLHLFINIVFTVHISQSDGMLQRRTRFTHPPSPSCDRDNPPPCILFSPSAVPIVTDQLSSCCSLQLLLVGESHNNNTKRAGLLRRRGTASCSSERRATDYEEAVVVPAHAFTRRLALVDLVGRRRRRGKRKRRGRGGGRAGETGGRGGGDSFPPVCALDVRMHNTQHRRTGLT
jgi:hypothetical protein